jgi:hypothetical protein
MQIGYLCPLEVGLTEKPPRGSLLIDHWRSVIILVPVPTETRALVLHAIGKVELVAVVIDS